MSFGFSLEDLRRHIGDDDADELSAVSSMGASPTGDDTSTPDPYVQDVALGQQDDGRRRGGGGGGQFGGGKLKVRNIARQLGKDYSDEHGLGLKGTHLNDPNYVKHFMSKAEDILYGPPGNRIDGPEVRNQGPGQQQLDNDDYRDDNNNDDDDGGGGQSGGELVTGDFTVFKGQTIKLSAGGKLTAEAGDEFKISFKNGLCTSCSKVAPTIDAEGELTTATCGDSASNESGGSGGSNAYQPPGG